MKKQIFWSALIVLAALVCLAAPAMAQSASMYLLNFNRDFGYGNGSNVQGSFTIRLNSADAAAEANIQSVTFLIDGQTMNGGPIGRAPFKLSFKTGDYPPGWHTFTASVVTKDGQTLVTPARKFNFLTAAEASRETMNIVVPLLGTVFALIVIGMGFQFLSLRGKGPLAKRKGYGVWGAVVCPRCGHPYGGHWWAPNLAFATKFDRCDDCGKWSVVRRASAAELAAAELACQKNTSERMNLPEKSEEEKMREMLDNSRYTQ